MTYSLLPSCTRCFHRLRFLLIVPVLLTLAGCGQEVYEERAEFSRDYFEFIDRLDKNLGSTFNNFGTTMRVPRQFSEIPAPPPVPRTPPGSTEEGGEESDNSAQSEREEDPRQPDYLDVDVKLPGLVAAWKAELSVVNSEGKTTPRTGYLYLLSNYEYWQTFKTKREIGDPTEFHDEVDDLVDTLVDEYQIRLEGSGDGANTNWHDLDLPDQKYEEFVPRKTFSTITLVPETPEEESTEEDVEWQFQVFKYKNGDMRIALVLIVPRNVSAGENLENRLRMTLQTLELTKEKPSGTAAAPGNQGGGNNQPQNSGPGF